MTTGVNAELIELHAEVQDVKAALRNGSAYLGMKGDQLSQYFLQLNAKENLLLNQSLQVAQPAPQPINGGGYTQTAPAQTTSESKVQALDPVEPTEPVPAFDSKSISSIVQHLIACERYHSEVAKALRALRSLGASVKASDSQLIEQILRLMQLHATDDVVVLGCVHILCTMADEVEAALGSLAQESVVAGILETMSRPKASKKVVDKCSEALARIIAAGESEQGKYAGGPKAQLTKLFSALVQAGDASYAASLISIFESLMIQEAPLINLSMLSRALSSAADKAKASAAGATCWLDLARQLAAPRESECWTGLQLELAKAGSIATALELMGLFETTARVQLTGLSSLSALIGVTMEALEAFAEAGGLARIEAAMRAHADNVEVQTKGMRSLGSGVGWNSDMQKKAGYEWRTVISVGKLALTNHGENVELASAALEALAKIAATDSPIRRNRRFAEGVTVELSEEFRSGDFAAVVDHVCKSHPKNDKIQQSARVVLIEATVPKEEEA